MFPRCSFSTNDCTLSIDKVVIKADFVLSEAVFFSTLQRLFYPCDAGLPVHNWFCKFPKFSDDSTVSTDLAIDSQIGLFERTNKSVIDDEVTLFPVKVEKFVSFHNLSYNWLYNITSLTDTFGRGGFSIHGGDVPGSAGCIDLTSGMPGFAEWFKNNGKDLIIKVEY